MHDLVIILCFTNGPRFDEFAKVVRLCEFVDKANAFCGLTISFEFVEIKKITRVGMVWNAAIRIKTRIFKVLLVVSQNLLHEFQKGIPHLYVIYIVLDLVRVLHESKKSIINMLKIRVGSFCDPDSCSKELFSQSLEISWHFADPCSELLCENFASVKIDLSDFV
jgi:hypothetical protein